MSRIRNRLISIGARSIGPVVLFGLVLAACQERFDLSTLPEEPPLTVDTSYVEISPPFPAFTGAEDLMIGRDQLLYVADTEGDRVVMMNRAGQVMSSRRILRPMSLAQDSRLDLLVGGRMVTARGDSISALFRLHLVSASPDSAHRLEVAPVDTLWTEAARPARRFPGIAVFGDNSYLVVRNGPDNSSLVDPDTRILLFSAQDAFITPVSDLATRPGGGITDIYFPTGIAAFPSLKDFVLVQSTVGVSYTALWMRYQQDSEFQGWLPRFDPARPEDRTVDFIKPNRFDLPQAVAIDPVRRDVFIADAVQDTIVKFNSRGAFKSESFGRVRTGGALRRPTGLAFYERVLYVLDGEAGLIFRYRLSTDVPH